MSHGHVTRMDGSCHIKKTFLSHVPKSIRAHYFEKMQSWHKAQQLDANAHKRGDQRKGSEGAVAEVARLSQ